MRLDMLTPARSGTPYVVLDAGGRTGTWLVDFGSTITSVYAENWEARTAPAIAFNLPGIDPEPRRLPAVVGGAWRPRVGAPLGTLGTDILRSTTTEIHFEEPSDAHLIFRDPSCDRDDRRDARDSRVGQADFFSSHPETHTSRLPNVPVVFVELEERSTDQRHPRLEQPKRTPRTWAQIDTGYADTHWPYSVDINEPYLARLRTAVPSLALTGLVPVSGCGRDDTLRDVYVAPGWRLNVVPDIPQRPIRFEGYHLIVKPSRTECGGIGPMLVPAAQLGASFLKAFGTTVFRPHRAEVRIRPGDRD